MKAMTQAQIERQITEGLTCEGATQMVGSLLELLWGPEADQEWGPDTLAEVASLLHAYGFGPDHAISED